VSRQKKKKKIRKEHDMCSALIAAKAEDKWQSFGELHPQNASVAVAVALTAWRFYLRL